LSTRRITVLKPAIDRRALLTGRVLAVDPAVKPPGGEIASILVQLCPDRIEEVEAVIAGLTGCEIYGRDPRGKLVVVVEALDASSLGSTLNAIALLPHVYSASLVFHAIDAGSNRCARSCS
jgi:periplasmic nitrate reductase NapD